MMIFQNAQNGKLVWTVQISKDIFLTICSEVEILLRLLSILWIVSGKHKNTVLCLFFFFLPAKFVFCTFQSFWGRNELGKKKGEQDEKNEVYSQEHLIQQVYSGKRHTTFLAFDAPGGMNVSMKNKSFFSLMSMQQKNKTSKSKKKQDFSTNKIYFSVCVLFTNFSTFPDIPKMMDGCKQPWSMKQ